MSYAPQDFFQWLSAVSVPVAGYSLKYAQELRDRFITLEALFKEKSETIKELDSRQREDSATIKLHSQIIGQLQQNMTSINDKLESLPRIATLLETVQASIAELKHRSLDN